MKLHVSFFILLVAVALGGARLWGMCCREAARADVVAMKWGDGKYGSAFYGACVYLQPAGSVYSVRGRIYIGPGAVQSHDCGQLGIVSSEAEAVERWGTIDWRPDGLHIGGYFLPRSVVEAHR
jgi:hypothetical protein